MELAEVINQELVENPVLEELAGPDEEAPAQAEEAANSPEAEQKRDEESLTRPLERQEEILTNKEDFNWESYIDDFNSTSSSAPSMKEINEELPTFESVLTKTTTLEDHLAWQLSMVNVTDQERKLGELIIGNLSDDGYLMANLED